jgi:predicted nuclease of predicted toxin-antitoxin system
VTAERPTLRIFLDAGVPDSVGAVFEKDGHYVIHYRDVLPEKVVDQVVCATALKNNAILVGIDRDMKEFPRRFGVAPNSDRFKRLSIIRLCCNETLASKRLEQAMTLIEHEWAFSEEKFARRLWVDVGPHHIRTNR